MGKLGQLAELSQLVHRDAGIGARLMAETPHHEGAVMSSATILLAIVSGILIFGSGWLLKIQKPRAQGTDQDAPPKPNASR